LKFTIARGWDSKDTPRNLIFAVFVELSELCELFQWKPEDQLSLSRIEWDKAAQEIADVLIYTMKLSNSVSPINVEQLERFVGVSRK
jgi:NTP pyrophosphatase (non-canonical NTP hydrolase)